MPDLSKPAYTQSLGGQQLTGAAASTALTVPNGATMAILKPRAQAVYLSLDGTAAGSTKMLIDVGVSVEITSRLSDVRVMEAAGGAVIDVLYFG